MKPLLLRPCQVLVSGEITLTTRKEEHAYTQYPTIWKILCQAQRAGIRWFRISCFASYPFIEENALLLLR
jgi:hypothetical protein